MEFRKTLRYGFYAALTLVILSWLNFYALSGMSPGAAQIGSFAAILLSTIWIPLGVRYARDKHLGGRISFWRSFFIGAWIGLISALGMLASTIIFMAINADRFQEWAADEGLPAEQTVVMAPVEQGIIMAILVMFIFSVASLVYSVFLRNTK